MKRLRRNPGMSFPEDYAMELYNQKIIDIITKCHKRKRQSWTPIPLGIIGRIWKDFMNTGFVHDIDTMEKIVEDITDKIITLEVNTVLAGHTGTSLAGELEGLGIAWTEQLMDKVYDYIVDDKGGLRISDYALDPLYRAMLKMLGADTPEQQIVIIDGMLNIVHARSDLAAWFIEGGRSSLDILSGVN